MKHIVSLGILSTMMVVGSLAHAEDRGEAGPSARSATEQTITLSTPTPLVTPAAALPAWQARALLGVDGQRPAGALDAMRPELAGEVGLGRGLTVGAGSRWIGGDTKSTADGLSPFAMVRLQLFGDGVRGWSGGVGLVYKQVGFGGGEREAEGSFSATFRARWFELGAQAVLGQSLRDAGEHDLEARAYGTYRLLPMVSIGVAGQARAAVGEVEPGAAPRRTDWLFGAIASAYVGRFQLGVLAGGTNLGLVRGVGASGQAFASYLF